MFNFFKQTKKEKIVVIDIRDGSVGGMILSIDKTGKGLPEKLFSIRKKLPFQKTFNYKRLFYATSRAITAIISELNYSGHGSPDRIICLIGSHLHISQRRDIRVKYSQPTFITSMVLDKLISNDLQLFEEKHLTNSLTNGDSTNMLFEHKIMQIKLNGYETLNPVNKTVSDVFISLFASVMPRIVFHDIKNIISGNFHNNNIEFHSFSFLISDVMRGLNLDKNGLVVMQVEDEITEISVIRNGIIKDIASFPLGKNFLIRMISERFNTVPEEANSYLKMYGDKSGTKDVMDRMSDILIKTKESWSELFYQTIKKIYSHHLLPQNFYIVTDKDYRNIFFDFTKKTELSSLLSLNKPPEIFYLENHLFENYCKNKSSCPDDIYFLAASIFISRLPGSEGLTFPH